MNFDITWWITFNTLLITLMSVDLWMLKRSEKPSYTQSLFITLGWISIAASMAILLYFQKGATIALEFTTGYLIEWSLSIDNLFVFLMIFRYFQVPLRQQKKLLILGILGALVMRFTFIFVGIALIQRFHWLIYLFGAFLLITGFTLFGKSKSQYNPSGNPIIKLLKRFFPIEEGWECDKFFLRKNGTLFATQSLVVLILIESSDLMFALDSIPAIFAITLDPFIVYSCNALAIMGLRSLYFLIQYTLGLFHYLHHGVCLILIFVGVKMLLSGIYPIPTILSLGTILLIISSSIGLSLLKKKA